ncbi:MAG: HAMP domain-containing histidine kinase [Planctomycetes bacterium]|nr:HAMP domain-containing histidine kinase [Planctomycetota bacterium]
MRSILRIDPGTFLASLAGGLLPALLLIIVALISYYSLAGLSLPVLEKFHEERSARVRNLCADLARDVERRTGALAAAIEREISPEAVPGAAAAAPSAATTAPPEWDLVHAIACYRAPGLAVAPDAEAAREIERAEAILGALRHAKDEVQRVQALHALSALPAGLEDAVGFSYSLEAALLAEVPFDEARSKSLLRSAGRLDAATWDAAVSAMYGGFTLSGIPLPIVPAAGAPPVLAGELRLAAGDATRLLAGAGGGAQATFVLILAAPKLLESGIAQLNRAHAGEGEVLLVTRGAGAADLGAARGGDDSLPETPWPLDPPFAERWSLVEASPSTGTPALVGLLQRLQLTNYLWLGIAVLLLGTATCGVLAVIVSRRVRASRSKDDFLRLVSHELRTPIASMRVLVETLSLGRVRDAKDQEELIRHLDGESGRLSDLVERVLEYGRTEGGRARVREVITDPGEVVNAAVKVFEERHPGRGEIRVRTAQEFHPVVLDREAVIRVVLNLLSNAHKFAGEANPIDVTVGEESFHLFIEVRDQGPGIARREQRKIFRTFYRGNHNGTPGFGLGLAYCREVAEAHRGKMRVRSAPGAGAAFTLEIPLVHPKEKGSGDGSRPGR